MTTMRKPDEGVCASICELPMMPLTNARSTNNDVRRRPWDTGDMVLEDIAAADSLWFDRAAA
jgi:hypothetical protein